LSYLKAVPGYHRVAALSVSVIALLGVGPATALAAGLGKQGRQRFGNQTLMLGSTGNAVTTLQRDLAATGFNVTATGTFTRATVREVRELQAKYNLQVDGVAGRATWKELEHLLSSVNHITEAAPSSVAGSAGVVTTDQSDAVPKSDVLPSADSGGVGFVPTTQSAAVVKASLVDGLAVPAPGTPQTVVDVIDAANKIAFLPYIYGGGHQNYLMTNGITQLDAGYDCSGSVSFALHGGNLLAGPLDSEQFLSYGAAGVGNWITLYSQGTYHVYMNVAGLWFDTATQSATNGNDRWSTTRTSPRAAYVPRHPAGW
jgi:peptidoglycan hydrolase-like protein with peptidoglycan-binding domain